MELQEVNNTPEIKNLLVGLKRRFELTKIDQQRLCNPKNRVNKNEEK